MEIQQGDERASYGDAVLEKLSEKLTNEFGKGFSKRNLERMRKFYICFPIATTVSSQLSWSILSADKNKILELSEKGAIIIMTNKFIKNALDCIVFHSQLKCNQKYRISL